jgi:hypothetical protein
MKRAERLLRAAATGGHFAEHIVKSSDDGTPFIINLMEAFLSDLDKDYIFQDHPPSIDDNWKAFYDISFWSVATDVVDPE